MWLKTFIVHILKYIKKKILYFFFSKWLLYTMTAEEPLNLRRSATDSSTAVILAKKNSC